jgi:hypothetical protein
LAIGNELEIKGKELDAFDKKNNKNGIESPSNPKLNEISSTTKLNENHEGKPISKSPSTLTFYFNKDPTSTPDAENFFGNGIHLHKLRTSPHARYFNTVALLKNLLFEPVLVSLQMLPMMQVTLLLSIQLAFICWLALCGFKEKIFVSTVIFIATLVSEMAILVFLFLGLVFQASQGVKSMMTPRSIPLQFVGVALLLLATVLGMVDLLVTTFYQIRRALAKRKVNKYLVELRKKKDEQEESLIKLRDEEGQKSKLLDQPEEEPSQGLMDRRNLSPFWRLKFKKTIGAQANPRTLKRPDLKLQ